MPNFFRGENGSSPLPPTLPEEDLIPPDIQPPKTLPEVPWSEDTPAGGQDAQDDQKGIGGEIKNFWTSDLGGPDINIDNKSVPDKVGKNNRRRSQYDTRKPDLGKATGEFTAALGDEVANVMRPVQELAAEEAARAATKLRKIEESVNRGLAGRIDNLLFLFKRRLQEAMADTTVFAIAQKEGRSLNSIEQLNQVLFRASLPENVMTPNSSPRPIYVESVYAQEVMDKLVDMLEQMLQTDTTEPRLRQNVTTFGYKDGDQTTGYSELENVILNQRAADNGKEKAKFNDQIGELRQEQTDIHSELKELPAAYRVLLLNETPTLVGKSPSEQPKKARMYIEVHSLQAAQMLDKLRKQIFDHEPEVRDIPKNSMADRAFQYLRERNFPVLSHMAQEKTKPHPHYYQKEP